MFYFSQSGSHLHYRRQFYHFEESKLIGTNKGHQPVPVYQLKQFGLAQLDIYRRIDNIIYTIFLTFYTQ